MKVLILNKDGHQQNSSFVHHEGTYKKGDTIFEPIDKQLWKIKEIVIIDHYIQLYCKKVKLKELL